MAHRLSVCTVLILVLHFLKYFVILPATNFKQGTDMVTKFRNVVPSPLWYF